MTTDLRFLAEHTADGRIELVAVAERDIPAGTVLRLVHLGGAVAAVAHVIRTPAAPPANTACHGSAAGAATSHVSRSRTDL